MVEANAPPPVLFEAPGLPSFQTSVPSPLASARARGTPGSQPARGPVRQSERSHRIGSHHGPAVTPAFRARCEWLALRQPRRTDDPVAGFPLISSAGGPRPVGRITAAWASVRRVYVWHPSHGHRTSPRVSWRWSDAPCVGPG